VTIRGTNLRDAVLATIGGVRATYGVSSASEVVATVPRLARSGLVKVTAQAATTSLRIVVLGAASA
jgi:hypothetical protein